MDEIIKIIFDWLKGQSIGTVMILFALIYMYRKSKNDAAVHANAVKTALEDAEQERKNRWGDVAENMSGLRVRIEECEKDRRRMWQGMFKLGLKVRPDEDGPDSMG